MIDKGIEVNGCVSHREWGIGKIKFCKKNPVIRATIGQLGNLGPTSAKMAG